jgi:phage head maturation protease
MADTFEVEFPVDIEVREGSSREIDMRLVPWDTPVNTVFGVEEFARGAFEGTDPSSVKLFGASHEARMGIGQDGMPKMVRVPIGKATALSNRHDGQYATFRVAKTAAGDETYALAAEGIISGVSLEFGELPGGTNKLMRNGRRVRRHEKAQLTGASLTHRPTYEQAQVLAVRSQDEEGPKVADAVEGTVIVPEPVDLSPVISGISSLETRMAERIGALEESYRSQFTIPAVQEADQRSLVKSRGDWALTAIKLLSGERVADQQMREFQDLVTSDNLGVVPDAFLPDMIGVIDPTRPFLNSTTRLSLPPAGMELVVPRIVTRPTVGVQSVFGDESQPEKSDVTSTPTSIDNVSFQAITVAGGGDISVQLLRRSSPSYLELFTRLLAEAYAQETESLALDSLLSTVGAGGGVHNGGFLDPNDLLLADAWANGTSVKKPINTMWLSSFAVGAFIDAKASGTNAPLYSQIQSGFTAGAGPAGTISGLRPVYVPALDATSWDVLVGPSSGFAWTEDGTFTLQVDVPTKAGRDVALVGIVWNAPLYPTAFTAYNIAVS